MTAIIRVDLGNAAFHDAPGGIELARILRALADRLDGDSIGKNDCRPLIDSNGNRVGEYRTTKR